jgi:hypothetical protein
MDKIREVLAEVRALDEAATAGPWHRVGSWVDVGSVPRRQQTIILNRTPDATFIVHSRTLLPRLAAALAVALICPDCDGAGVLDLGREPYYRNRCNTCDGTGSTLPEPVLAAIAAALEER